MANIEDTDSAVAMRNEGDPYRSPAEVTSSPPRAWTHSPIAWGLIAGVLAGVLVMFAVSRSSTEVQVIQHADELGQYVEDFGATRVEVLPRESNPAEPVGDAIAP